ncbi:hypothetical protein CPLU01_11645 [Colletotrichum plurivorum]|uniref:Uncharacterized protein n=1 Tax=Colletotrichum plurivorum TaxID=2175906 RepID=A0A8H6N870_9PEZI|nr:hypothetical protein CPLU01_11645 [Colletotrichum plurivorum]
MEDQYGGRTDDDLFFDDFEPVEDPQPVESVAAPPAAPPPATVTTPPVEPPKPEPVAPKTAQKQSPPPPVSKPPPKAPRGLANSRFNPDKTAAAPRPPRQATPAAVSDTPTTASPAPTTNTSNAPPQAPTGPRAQTPSAPKSNSPAPTHAHAPHREKQGAQGSGAAVPGANTALNAEARMKSGANPRTKLTEAELAAKMEQMRILNAEKTRKFEQAEQDERSHAEAYARGMEEARKRKKADEERRRRGEEDRRRMDDERAKNRERKLKAMSIKEGGWDEGKDALAAEEERRVFRGANGGIRGARSAGLSGSRFANEGDADAGFEDRRGGRGRGRGRGQGRGGRGGGRGGYSGDLERDAAAAPPSNGARAAKSAAPEPKAPAITTEEFPALPGKATSGEKTPPVLSPPILSPLGRWDEEVESYEASKMNSGAAQS